MKCATCGSPNTREAIIDGRLGVYCLDCFNGTTAYDGKAHGHGSQPRTADLTLPLTKGRHTKKIIIKEADAQQAVVKLLEFHGYIVKSTSERRKKSQCQKCGAWGYPGFWKDRVDGTGKTWTGMGTGVDKAIGDLQITSFRWPAYCWMAMEVKGTETPVSPEQAILAEQDRNTILRAEESLDYTAGEALRRVREFESTLRNGESKWRAS